MLLVHYYDYIIYFRLSFCIKPIIFRVRNHLRGLLAEMARQQKLHDVSLLTKDFHVWPDFHGNRSPLADPTMKGMIVGLTINSNEDNLALLYLATMQALAVSFFYLFLEYFLDLY